MIGHNKCFKGVIWKIIPKLSLLPLLIWSTESSVIKGRFQLFQMDRNSANVFSKFSVSTFYKEISKFQQTVRS